MEKVITKTNLKQQPSDFQYWQQQAPQKRLETLEQIRQMSQIYVEDSKGNWESRICAIA